MREKFQYYDLIILGAGITGLSIARQQLINDPACKTLIIEKERTVGMHASGRNSGVLHSGIYYPSNTLKAKFCSEGRKLMEKYCQEYGLPIQKCGKVIVPQTQDQDEILDTLQRRSKLNGAKTSIISEDELKKVEPEVYSISSRALYSPQTSVVDPDAILKNLVANLLNKNVEFAYEEHITSADPENSVILTNKNLLYKYGQLINCTGQFSDLISHIFNIGKEYHLIPFKGMYYKLKENTEMKLNGLIYPVPDSRFPFLGIHSVKLINGDVYFGPNSIPALGRENYRGIKGISWRDSIKNSYILLKKYLENNEGFRTFSHRESLQFFKYAFYMHIKKMLPKIKYTDIAASNKVGIRAQLINKHTNNFEMDFIVERKDNTIHVLNSVSPAFTSSFAFAPYILNSK